MSDREKLHAAFHKKFHVGESVAGATQADVDAYERAIDTLLPASFAAYIMAHGMTYAPAILDTTAEMEDEFPDLQNIMTLAESSQGTQQYWTAGMPKHVAGFASDSMGNMFGFERIDRTQARPDDAPVLFFDHDLVEVRKISDGFDELLQWYLENC